jgi:hypothetical protein
VIASVADLMGDKRCGCSGACCRSELLGDERCKLLVRRMPPANAERVPGWVGVDLVPFVGAEIGSRQEQPGAEGNRLFMCRPRILDVQIEMDLLGSSIRPIGRNVVWRELDADAPGAGGIEHAVKSLVSVIDVAAENLSPERAFSRRVCGIEHDYLTHHFHTVERYTGAPRGRLGAS